jgi:trimethylamine--corrinoid protein Co-methyltransferase
MSVPWSGAQYIHYAFGLLERTNTFCPEQAVLDDAHIGIIKRIFGEPEISNDKRESVLGMINEVMDTPHKTYIYNLPMPSKEDVYIRYPLENDEGGALLAAHNRFKEIMDMERRQLPPEIQKEIKSKVGGIVDKTLKL